MRECVSVHAYESHRCLSWRLIIKKTLEILRETSALPYKHLTMRQGIESSSLRTRDAEGIESPSRGFLAILHSAKINR